jgi:four helix bundle protein
MSHEFAHESLDWYKLAVAVSRWASKQHLPPNRKHLRDQLVRAADSIALNIAEGAGLGEGDGRRNHFRIALGSAAEMSAIIDVCDFSDGEERREDVRRIGAMLGGLARR